MTTSAVRISTVRQRLRSLGARPVHEERVLRQWARAEPLSAGRRRPEDFLPLALRTALPAVDAELRALAVLRADHAAADGSRRLLVGLADGRSVEAVLLPRGGLCV
ncbi:MAG: rRNA methyltransferase, partial [Caldimonas sp.]